MALYIILTSSTKTNHFFRDGYKVIVSRFRFVFATFLLYIGAPEKLPPHGRHWNSRGTPADRVGNTVRENSWPGVMRRANTSHTHTPFPHPHRVALPDVRVRSVCVLIYFRRCLLTLRVNGNCGRLPRYLKTTHTTLYATPNCKHTHVKYIPSAEIYERF